MLYSPIYDKNKNILKYESLVCIKDEDDESEKLIDSRDYIEFSKISNSFIYLKIKIIKESFELIKNHNVHVAINLTYEDMQSPEIQTLIIKSTVKKNFASKVELLISTHVINKLLEHDDKSDYYKLIAHIKKPE